MSMMQSPDGGLSASVDVDLAWFSDWWREGGAAPSATPSAAAVERSGEAGEPSADLAWFDDWWRSRDIPPRVRFTVVPSQPNARPAHDLRWFNDWWAA